jgi:predicted DNA-binding antitoxin AbrB/MazE fold protein
MIEVPMTITVQAVYAGGVLRPLQPLTLKEGETVEVTVAQPEPAQTVDERFRELAAAWEQAVAYQSSSTERNSHPAYRAIIALGPDVVPLLLRDLEKNHTYWFCALREITGADPIPESAAGNIPKMVDAWLCWAREKHR